MKYTTLTVQNFIFSLPETFLIFVLLISYQYVIENKTIYSLYNNKYEYFIIIIYAIIGILLVISSYDIISLYLGLELQSIALYILAAFRKNKISIEAGLKYFLLGSLASIFILFGFSFLYGLTGLTSFLDLSEFCAGYAISSYNLISSFLFYFSIFFIIIGLFFKLGVVPFHFLVSHRNWMVPIIIINNNKKKPSTINLVRLYHSTATNFGRVGIFTMGSNYLHRTFNNKLTMKETQKLQLQLKDMDKSIIDSSLKQHECDLAHKALMYQMECNTQALRVKRDILQSILAKGSFDVQLPTTVDFSTQVNSVGTIGEIKKSLINIGTKNVTDLFKDFPI